MKKKNIYRLMDGDKVFAEFTNIAEARKCEQSNKLAVYLNSGNMLQLVVECNKSRFYFEQCSDGSYHIIPIGRKGIVVGVCFNLEEAKECVEWCNKYHW
jgi:hypothetical protein